MGFLSRLLGQGSTPVNVEKSVVLSSSTEVYDPANPMHRHMLDAAESATGMDLDGDGTVAGGAPPASGSTPLMRPAAPPQRDDRLELLERLARLRDDGALTAEEFEAEKRRILSDG